MAGSFAVNFITCPVINGDDKPYTIVISLALISNTARSNTNPEAGPNRSITFPCDEFLRESQGCFKHEWCFGVLLYQYETLFILRGTRAVALCLGIHDARRHLVVHRMHAAEVARRLDQKRQPYLCYASMINGWARAASSSGHARPQRLHSLYLVVNSTPKANLTLCTNLNRCCNPCPNLNLSTNLTLT